MNFFIFFFQAEDGIRDKLVTGVQTCALPISLATAAADTAGSEIGQLWGRRTFLITTLRPVARGTQGAVSVAATVAGIVGSTLVGALGWAAGLYASACDGIVAVAASVGTTLQILIRATLERRG